MSGLPAGEVRARLRLWLTPDVGAARADALLERFGSAEAVLEASPAGLRSVRGIGRQLSDSIARGLRASTDLLDRELEDIERVGGRAVVRGNADYPPALTATPDGPLALVVRGSWTDDDLVRPGVALVGSRRASAYGLEQASRFGGALARSGLTVVSGGARGVDSAAHRGALRSGGRTLAVLGSGLLELYPKEHAELFASIADAGGAVVSEFPCSTPPAPDNFPRRNRIISGLSLGVLVVEAARKSGALITARHANEAHGREVMALPGRVDSPECAGSLELLRDGAHLVIEPADVLGVLEHGAWLAHHDAGRPRASLFDADPTGGGVPASESASSAEPSDRHSTTDGTAPVRERAAKVLAALGEPSTPDEAAARCGLTAAEVRAELTMLELAGLVARDGTRLRRR